MRYSGIVWHAYHLGKLGFANAGGRSFAARSARPYKIPLLLTLRSTAGLIVLMEPFTLRVTTRNRGGCHRLCASWPMLGLGNLTRAVCPLSPVFDSRVLREQNTESGESDNDDGRDRRMANSVVTANGVFGYDTDWNGIESSTRPETTAAKLLHVARQRTDTSRWWTMRWPVDAISLLSRAGRLDATKTYDLMRKLRQLSNTFVRELWEAAVERRREIGSAALRESTREEWVKHKRRLGSIGRDRKGKLMPSWESVRRLPLYRVRQQLARWTLVSFSSVLRGGQRTFNSYVTRARDATKRPADGDDDGAVAATSKQRRDAPPERPQR